MILKIFYPQNSNMDIEFNHLSLKNTQMSLYNMDYPVYPARSMIGWIGLYARYLKPIKMHLRETYMQQIQKGHEQGANKSAIE